MRIFFDLNVVLDLVLDRAPWSNDAIRLTERVLSGAAVGIISSASVPTLYYVARRAAGAERALVAVRRCLATFEPVPVTMAILQEAVDMPGVDFEDNLQAAAAHAAGAQFLISRDATGFRQSRVPPLTPTEFLSRNP